MSKKIIAIIEVRDPKAMKGHLRTLTQEMHNAIRGLGLPLYLEELYAIDGHASESVQDQVNALALEFHELTSTTFWN